MPKFAERNAALLAGLPRYFTGKPCKKGHIAERVTVSAKCTACKDPRKYMEVTTPEQRAQYARKRRLANPKKIRAQIRKYRGLPEPMRPEPDVCECCGKKPECRSVSLDHCHATGKFRGWLCQPCNLAVGLLGDDLALAIEQLTRYALVASA